MLRLVAGGYTNQAIAEELVVAVSTVKKHVNNLFGKSGVSSRTQAVSRATELHILRDGASIRPCGALSEAPIPGCAQPC